MNLAVDARQLLAKLGELKRQAEPKAWLTAIGNRLIKWVNDNFKDQGTEEKWKPLSPNTIANRRGGGGGAQALMDTGRLRMSFGPAAGNPHLTGVDTVAVTSNVQYAPYHEFGTAPFTVTARPGHMLAFKVAGGGMAFAKEVHNPGIPKRPMLPSEPVARRVVLDTLNAILQKALAMAQRAAEA